ncbi:MAG: DNA mismatch repair protein MutS [Calditrichaeota bacterium]|nr:DNA mismatch repair protein MutS [Calditrichota bacterium]MCB9391544.1 DNA mismatch repair protein MutS [Calditrichota bacterium]
MSTPMLKQYAEIKSQYPDVILFYRMGDFYELFYDDARTASDVLGLTLTKRNNGKEGDVPLAGFPHHQLENYLSKMTRAGYRVAVCDQLEDPTLAKGIVKRGVTEVVSAGTTFSTTQLADARNNYLAAVLIEEQSCGLAYADVTAQEFFTGILPVTELAARLHALEPAELIVSADDETQVRDLMESLTECALTVVPKWQFAEDGADRALRSHLNVANLKGYGLGGMLPAVRSAGALLHYLRSQHKNPVELLPDLRVFSVGQELVLDHSTRRNLELVESLSGRRDATLLFAVDRTRTAAGGRLLRRWLLAPLTDRTEIDLRHDALDALLGDPQNMTLLSDHLRETSDLQRLMSRLTTRRASPRDAVAICRTLEKLPVLQKMLSKHAGSCLDRLASELQEPREISGLIRAILAEDPPAMLGEGKAIRTGYSAELDELRSLGTRARTWMQEHQIKERDRTGIPSLKIGYNKVFGYYIEVTNAHKDRIPADYIRKQTLTGAERYVTPDLKSWEEKILTADEKISRLEEEIWESLRTELIGRTGELTRIARALAELDVLVGLAVVAREQRFVRPQISESTRLNIVGGRHPVVERLVSQGGGFIANDLNLDTETRQIMILTGPNMSGKSTFLRQNALIVLLAQMGSFVPAEQAEIGTVDRIFTRIGAGDNLAGGESTFLVEMSEVSNILRHATQRSLLILDEVGRGTSTYDGLSLAWAITEYLHEHSEVAGKTLFATHYHELNRMAGQYPRIFNARVEVEEWGDRVVFLHRISSGETDRSYGIEVARLAGLPEAVVARARELLPRWEESAQAGAKTLAPDTPKLQLTLFESDTQKVADALRSLKLDDLTPRDALDKLYEIKRLIEKDESAKRV